MTNSFDIIYKKYPKGYFDQYVAMFASELTQDGYEEHASLFIHFEGMEEFTKLVNEIKLISANNDWHYYAEINEDEEDPLTLENIKAIGLAAIEIFNSIKKK